MGHGREQGFPPSLKDAVTGFHHHEGTLLALLKEYHSSMQSSPLSREVSELLEVNLVEPLVRKSSRWEPEVGKTERKA